MEISFTKRDNNDHIISCKRKDGSVTWMQNSSFFILHDICHFALETVLHLNNGFYGMLAAGTNIKDFDLPKDKRTFQLTDEAIFAEHMVNLLTIEYSQGKVENFIVSIKDSCSKNGLTVIPKLEEKTIKQIRQSFKQLMLQWDLLSPQATMRLTFEI